MSRPITVPRLYIAISMSGLKSNLQDSDSDEEPEFLQYKVVLLGDGTVGKTSIAMRLCDAEFSTKYKQTIGLDFFVKRMVLPGSVHVALQIWDIGGQSIGSKMLGTYVYGAQAVVLIYDITNYQSFVNLEEWLQVVNQTFPAGDKPYMALVGNKTDLFHQQVVKLDKHNKFADDNTLYSYLLSAKTGDQLYNTFYRVAADLAGVVLTADFVEAATVPIRAEVVEYANAPAPSAVEMRPSEGQAPKKKGSKCEVF